MSDEATDRATFEALMEAAKLDEHAEWLARTDYCNEHGHDIRSISVCLVCYENFTTGARDDEK